MPDMLAIDETERQIKVTEAISKMREELIGAIKVSIDNGEFDTADALLEVDKTVESLIDKHLCLAEKAHAKAADSVK